MDSATALSLAVPLALGIAGMGCGIGIGRAVASAMEAIGRQPEAGQKIFIYMLVGCGLIEALTLYVLAFPLIFGIKFQ